MSNEIELLKFVCRRLDKAEISYMLTGSLAANFYLVPRMTRDIDFVINILPSEVDRFFHCFQNDFYIVKESIKEAIKHQGMFNAIHQSSVFKVDFIIRKDSSYREEEFQRKRQVLLGVEKIWIVSPEDLILSKLIWAKDSLSDLQLRDVKNLLSAVKNLDEQYLHRWMQRLELDTVYKKVTSNE